MATDYNAKCYNSAGGPGCKQVAGLAKSAGRCVCDNGCMGADGNCYTDENKLLADKFTLKNAQWPAYSMYVQRMSAFGQMKTTSTSSAYNMGQDLFRLYELPGLHHGARNTSWHRRSGKTT
mmetsp:Transcript_60676/g.196558  ORF Transcript_60676/g.196558 Transcript_60676/m.196558 type:complete len:121 (+) Transcript_60676:164-526(+)